jgi:hypothetical protein
LIEQVQEAACHGVVIRFVHNAGAGEPTLHPEFRERMEMFGHMVRDWKALVPPPEIAIVTNGSNLLKQDVIAALRENPIDIYISFPTAVPEAYGSIMFGDATQGSQMLEKVIPGIRKTMELSAQSGAGRLHFNVSPPQRDVIRRDFSVTVDFLTRLASETGLPYIQLVMLPATFNRTGLVANRFKTLDNYRYLFQKFNGKMINGVKVSMTTSQKKFFPQIMDFVDLLRAFDYPCMRNANLFLAADGSSICPNDQAVRNPFGNLMTDNIEMLMHKKEIYWPNNICAECDAAPHQMQGSFSTSFFSTCARMRMAVSKRS